MGCPFKADWGGCEPSSIVEKKMPSDCHPEPAVAPYYLQAVAFSRVAFREETRWKALIGASS